MMRARCGWLCEEVRKKGPGAAVEVQNAMQRLALDMIMLSAFDMDPHAVDFQEAVILDSLHYVFNDIFRSGLDLCMLFMSCASVPLSAQVILPGSANLAFMSAVMAGEILYSAPFLAFTLCCAHHAAVLLQVMQAWGVLALLGANGTALPAQHLRGQGFPGPC